MTEMISVPRSIADAMYEALKLITKKGFVSYDDIIAPNAIKQYEAWKEEKQK